MKHDQFTQRLMSMDLNLLVVLNSLHETGSTVLTASQIGRTQPSVSLSLKRLRHLFSDPLFVRSGNSLKSTQLCDDLRLPVQKVLFEILEMIDVGIGFDPSRSKRKAVFAFPENAFSYAFGLKKFIAEAALGIDFQLKAVDLITSDYDAGTRLVLAGKIDLLLVFYRTEPPAGLDAIELPNQHWSTLARKGHDIPREPDIATWCSYDHIQVASGKGGRNAIGDKLVSIGAKRQIGLTTNNFLQALVAASQSDMLFTTMSPIITPLANQLGLVEIVPPIDLADVPLSLLVRERKNDPFSEWLLKTASEFWKCFAP